MSDQFELDFDAKVKEADDIEIAEYNFSPTLLENGVIDYSEIQHDKIFLVNKKDILERARPNWIPELDITGLLEDDFLPTTIKSSDGYYYVQTKKYVGMETNERTRVLEKKFETQIYKMSSDILAATVDYYIKKQRAENKKNGIKKTVSLPRRTKSMLTTRYKNMVELLRFIPEYKDNDELLRKYPIRSKSTAYKNQNTIIFNQYNELLSVLKGKTLDLNLAKQDFINAYAKGEITSYGDTGISNALYKGYGVKIKKQNGSTFSLEERNKLTDALDSVYNYYGNLSNLAKQYGLKISYADNCNQHARKAIGLFTNYHKAIGVSFFNDLNDESLTMAHETAHWLDSLKGKEFSYRMASDKDGTIENKIAEKYKKLIREQNENNKSKIGEQKTTKLGDYWYRTCECFARAIEQDFGLTIGLKERCHPPAYLPEEIFNKEIKPLVEELKKENEIKLNLIPGKFVTWTTKIKNKINEQEMSDRERDNLIWLEEVHECDKEKTAIVLHKLYEKFSESEAFERSKVLPTVFGKLRKQSESFELDFNDSSINEEELDTVLGIYDENITYHTVLGREWAVRHGMSKKEAAHLLEWDYSKAAEHKFIEIINKEELKEQEKENMSDVFDNKIENDEEYANELADWIIQESLECSVNKENYHISFEDIVEKTNTPIEWLNKNYKLVNEALAKHNDNELLEYNPEESNENEFNLNFCSNATENDENTLFKQNKQGRWVRKTAEELEQELKNNTKTIENAELNLIAREIEFGSIFETVSKEFNEKNKDFFNIYEEQKSKQIENLSKNISNIKEKMLFSEIHSEMLKIRVEELKEMVKRCPKKDNALAVGIRYFNYFGNIEGNISHQNLYTRFGIGHYENGQMVYPTPEELKSFISKLYENSKKQETYIWKRYEDGSCYLKAPNGEQYFVYDSDTDEVQIKEDSNWIRIDELNLGDKTFTQYAEDYVLEKNPATYISFETNGKNIEKEQNVDESKQYSFFVKDTAEFEMFEEFETITGLTAKEAISEYKKLREDGLAAGIGINIPSDTTFNDPKGLGTTILVRENGIDTFGIYGDSFIVDLKENNERSQNRIAAYKELYEEAKARGLNVKEPTFLFEKERELGLSNEMDGRVMETLGKTMEQQSYKYYTKRPVDIGTVPKGFASFENYDSYEYNEEAGRQVYGFVEYDRELSEAEIKEFELFKPNPYREFRIEPTKENGLKEPYILTGRRGSLQGTSLSNFEAYIQDARKVHKFDFLDSIEETIQFIENGFKRPKDTSLTINIKDYEIVKTDNKSEELSSEDIKLINNFKKENNLNLLNNPTSVELVTDEIKSDEVAILFNYDIDKSKLNDLFVIDEHHNTLLSDKDNNVKLSFKVSSGSLSNIDIQCYKENNIYNLSFWSDVTDTAKKELCNLLKEPFKSINNNIDFTQKGWNDEWHKIRLEQAEQVNIKDNRNWILQEAPTGSLSKYISSDKVVDIDEFREFAASKLEGNAEDKTYFKQMWILGAKFCKEKGWELPEISLSELLDEPGEKYNKDLIEIFADNEEFEQISNNKYVMEESEFNVVQKILTESKMDGSFDVIQLDNIDVFIDYDEDKIVSLKTGLSWLSDGLVEPTTDELSVKELSILKELLCKQNLFDKVDYINGLLEERSSEHPVSFSLRDITDEQLTELKEHLSNNGYDVQWKEKVQSSTSNSSWNNFTIELENYPYIITILEDRNLDFEYLVGLTSFGYDAAWLNFEDQKNTKFVTETEFKKINELNEKEFKDSHRPYIKINYTESWAKNHKPTRIEKGTVLGFVEGIKLIDELNKKFNTSLKSDISFYMWDEKQNDYVEYDPGFEFHDNIRILDNGKEITYTQTPITEEIRMVCSYPEILDLFEENWIKQFAPTITDEQKNFIKELTDASYTKLNERYNQGKETLRFIYDKYNEVHSSSIIEADVADATEQSLEIQQQAIARLFDKTLELFVTKIDLYLDENKDLLNKKEFLEYAKHKIFNVLQDVQFQESRNAKYGKNGYDFDFAFWNVTNEKILAAGDYNTEFEKILAIKEKSLQQTEEYAKEISNTFNSQNNEVTLQNLSDIPLMPKVTTVETKTQIKKENVELPFSIINNVEKGRVNIKFNQKISDKKFNSILKELKSAGWKFSSFNKQWYPDGKAVEKSETFAKELQERFSISEEKMTFAANTIEETEVRIQNTPYGNVRFFGRNYKELDDFVTYFNRNLDKFSKNVGKIDESIAETIFESLKIERSSAINLRSLRLGLDSADNLVLLDKEKSNAQTIVISLPELLSLAKSNLEKEKDEIDFKLAKFEKAENKEHYIKVFGNLFQNAKDKNTNLLSKMNLIYETYISEPKFNPKYEVLYPITKYGFKNKLKQIYEIDKHINNDVLSIGKKLLSLATEDDKKEISEWLKNDMGCEDENSLKKLFTNWVSEKEVKQQKKKDGYPSRGE